MATSACDGEATTVLTVDELFVVFTSFVVGAMLAVFIMVVPAVPEFVFTTSENCAVAPEATAAPEQTPALPGQQLIAPVPPAAGRVGQVTPAGMANETNVVPVGTVSL
jgi:hypothetical protein